ncbi:MAG: sulfatase family protein [Isosphaeraceae bacterium]
MRLFAGWLLLGSILGIQAGTVLGADRAPNIVLIVADDLGWGDVGFNGRTEWTTPHLDRLAADGVVLKHCYSAAPICGPSRAALLTGKYTIHTGVRRNDQDLPLEEVTIAEALKHRGYRSGLFRQVAARKAPFRPRPLRSPDGPGVRRLLRVHRFL